MSSGLNDRIENLEVLVLCPCKPSQSKNGQSGLQVARVRVRMGRVRTSDLVVQTIEQTLVVLSSQALGGEIENAGQLSVREFGDGQGRAYVECRLRQEHVRRLEARARLGVHGSGEREVGERREDMEGSNGTRGRGGSSRARGGEGPKEGRHGRSNWTGRRRRGGGWRERAAS